MYTVVYATCLYVLCFALTLLSSFFLSPVRSIQDLPPKKENAIVLVLGVVSAKLDKNGKISPACEVEEQ